jgi:hypothetical protein
MKIWAACRVGIVALGFLVHANAFQIATIGSKFEARLTNDINSNLARTLASLVFCPKSLCMRKLPILDSVAQQIKSIFKICLQTP